MVDLCLVVKWSGQYLCGGLKTGLKKDRYLNGQPSHLT